MNDPIGVEGETVEMPRGEGPGGRIGPFKILRQIGEGGFGAVFETEQEHPVKRRVALKVIKLGMDTREVIARFEAERQALAMMDHPHIARVLDAGATDSGRPYFVMELVKGEPISGYCRKHKLPIAERLQLFGQVCEAVQHAHTKGIIHRDLKPNNVLVSTQDDRPFAKVIDFGIAKATSGRLTDKTLFTEQFLMMGTPLYMSPEQAEGSADIDTRTDIYSLGVILYELLTDTTPIESNSLWSAGSAEIQRIIREVEPPPPSTRLSKSGTTMLGTETRKLSGSDSRRLTRLVRGELDWIVMKAIEKDRRRRYETANGLAMDVRRYLAGEPVLAAPPSASYRMRKFVRRHRGGVATAAMVSAALLVGIVGFAWQARIARARAAELEQVSAFQAEMLGQVDPSVAGRLLTDNVRLKFAESLAKAGLPDADRKAQVVAFGAQWQRVNATDAARDLIDSTILEPAVVAIDKQFKTQPALDASLRQVLADRYKGMGLFDAAMRLQKQALATRRAALGVDHPDTITSISHLGELLHAQGKFIEAVPYLREALERRRRVLGEDHRDTLTALNDMGLVLLDQNKLTDAERYIVEALGKRRRLLGNNDEATLISIASMAQLLEYQGKLADAEPYSREVLKRSRKVYGEEHPNTLTAINDLGELLQNSPGKLDQAEPLLREGLEKRRRILGSTHPSTLRSINNLGELLQDQGKLKEAEPYLREVLASSRTLGEDSADTLAAINNVGYVLQLQGRLDEAEPFLREVLEKSRRLLGDEHSHTIISMTSLGTLLLTKERFSDAEPLFHEALERSRHGLGPEHPQTLQAIHNMGKVLQYEGKLAEAETYFRDALAKRRRILGEDDTGTITSMVALGSVLQDEGRYTDAEPIAREASEKGRRALGDGNKITLLAIRFLASDFVAQGKADEAVKRLAPVEAATRKAFVDAEEFRVGQFLLCLGMARAGTGRFADAEAPLIEAQSILARIPSPTRTKDLGAAAKALVDLYSAWNIADPDKGRAVQAALKGRSA